jgi:heptosyltransferase-2
MKRILVLRGGALGDFIVTLPALRLLRERWPAARIELAGNSRAAELGLLAGVLDGVHSQAEARWAQLYAPAPLAPDFRVWLDGFDLIVSFWPDPERELCRHFAHRGASFIASDATVKTHPAAAHFCEALRPLGLETCNHLFSFDFPAQVRSEAARRLGEMTDFVAIHPGSGSPRKNWPLARWTELIERLQCPLLIVTGEAEKTLPRRPKSQPVVHAHNWPLPVLGAALVQSRRFIGHDSGISHLAAASGGRCVLLFGPTDPVIWAPPGARTIRRGESLASINVSDVLAAIEAPPGPATDGPW